MKNKNNEFYFFNILMISFVFTFLCCKEKDNIVVKVGYLPIIAHLPASIAKEKKYFGDLKVEYVIYSNSNDLLNDLNAGKIDIATTLAVAPIVDLCYYLKSKSMESDFKMKIFSYSITTSEASFDGTFVSDSNSVKDMSNLRGKKIGVFPGSTAKNIFAYHIKEKYGINSNEVTFINVPPPAQLDALKSGSVDVMFTYETIRTVLENEGLKIFRVRLLLKY
ncbi:MAG: ABC transporter substrate-binding protein [Saprospiraceae bacterium]|nr:ABC transporter substrate-binding protein [Candidatus Vicinibacter affinis]